jgi:hypothetical protein
LPSRGTATTEGRNFGADHLEGSSAAEPQFYISGPSETHEEADHIPSLSDSDSSGSDWELDQELEDDPHNDFFLEAPDGEPNGQGVWKVITPPRFMPVNLGEIEEEWADDLEAEMRTVAARVLSEHNLLVGKSGLRRHFAQDLTEADVLDVVLSKSGPVLVKALSEPGHDCSDDEVGLFINTALYLALIGKSPTAAYVSLAGENWLPTASRVDSGSILPLGQLLARARAGEGEYCRLQRYCSSAKLEAARHRSHRNIGP